jgi:hypothetical protein
LKRLAETSRTVAGGFFFPQRIAAAHCVKVSAAAKRCAVEGES